MICHAQVLSEVWLGILKVKDQDLRGDARQQSEKNATSLGPCYAAAGVFLAASV
jgi:hypothetical protein